MWSVVDCLTVLQARSTMAYRETRRRTFILKKERPSIGKGDQELEKRLDQKELT
jgi:hypothetical protein